VKSITYINENTIYFVEPGDKLLFSAEESHRSDWYGPRIFEVTVLRTILTSIHGPRIITVEQIDDGEGSTVNDFYLMDDWTIEVIPPTGKVA
jgi:hypothetical protein